MKLIKKLFYIFIVFFIIFILYLFYRNTYLTNEVQINNTSQIPEKNLSEKWFQNTCFFLKQDIKNIDISNEETEISDNFKVLLLKKYNIHDKIGANILLNNFINGKNNNTFLEEVNYFQLFKLSNEEIDNILDNIEDKEIKLYLDIIYYTYKDLKDISILGWDLANAGIILEYCFLSEYYSKSEYLEKCYYISNKIQNNFNGYDDYYNSIVSGYIFLNLFEDNFEKNFNEFKIKLDQNFKKDLEWKLNLNFYSN